MEKVHLTLYTAIGEPERITAAIETLFAPVTKQTLKKENKTTLTFHDDTQMTFSLSHSREQAEFITLHIQGMADYFAQVQTAISGLKEKVLQQIRCFNCVTGIVFETDDNQERTRYLVNTLFDLASEVNGFLLYPTMSLYNKEGKLVFSLQGESEVADFSPIADTDPTGRPKTEETVADGQRRERSLALLKEKGIPYLASLPVEATEQEACIKSREEMVQRAATLFAVAVYSEIMLEENPNRDEALTYFNRMDEIYGISRWLTPKETAFLSDPSSTEQERIQFVWRYENCAVLLWAAGIVEELPYPSDICDVPVIASIFWQHKSIADLLAEGSPRTQAEILDAADLTLCYDWACVDARIHGREAPAQLDGGVVMERHYTFSWLTSAQRGADWDDVQPDS